MNKAQKAKQPKVQFDLKTHIRDGKGRVSKTNPYRLVIENGVKKFERPPGSGNWYAENGQLLKSGAKKAVQQDKAELDKQALLDKIAALEAQLAAEPEAPEVEAQAEESSDEALDSIPAASELDNSEELALIEQASPEAKKSFQMPKFLGK